MEFLHHPFELCFVPNKKNKKLDGKDTDYKLDKVSWDKNVC